MKFPIYLDHHATTPCDDRVVQRMLPFYSNQFGNPSNRQSAFGDQAAKAVEESRLELAHFIGAAANEIVFTAGATESNNLAIFGVASAYEAKGKHLITVKTEHKAVMAPFRELERRGFEVSWLDVNAYGQVDPEQVKASIRPQTILVSVMRANNEIGTLQPIREIGVILKERGILFHTDAAQAIGRVPLNVDELGVDLLSVSAHKFYGPKGVGALYVRRRSPRVRLSPLFWGGGQERGLRSGTLNVPGIMGMGEAVRILKTEMPDEIERIKRLRDRLEHQLFSNVKGIHLNGHPTERLCNNLHVSFDQIRGQTLLDVLGEFVAVSTGSSCQATSMEPSHVLKAIGLSDDRAHSSLRMGLGRWTTIEEVDFVSEKMTQIINRLRAKPSIDMNQDHAGIS